MVSHHHRIGVTPWRWLLMVVNKEKVRKYVTLKIASVEYLEKRAKEEEKTRGKKVTVSELLEELIESDQTIRRAFTNRSVKS